ncbi:hypothetical protein NMG60_11025823 [Bertholletia excelsa]
MATCCLFFAGKKNKGDKGDKGDGVSGIEMKEGGEIWGTDDHMLSDPSTFSVKEQERRLKKAKQEQKKVIEKAERVINWVKQESARLDVSSINGILQEDHHRQPN